MGDLTRFVVGVLGAGGRVLALEFNREEDVAVRKLGVLGVLFGALGVVDVDSFEVVAMSGRGLVRVGDPGMEFITLGFVVDVVEESDEVLLRVRRVDDGGGIRLFGGGFCCDISLTKSFPKWANVVKVTILPT